MFQIYTDGSCREWIAYAATLILEDAKTYHTLFAFECAPNSTVAEIQAIRQGLQWIVENGYADEDVVVYTDLQYAVALFEERATCSDECLCQLFAQIPKLKIQYMKSHGSGRGLNSICDHLAYALTRME